MFWTKTQKGTEAISFIDTYEALVKNSSGSTAHNAYSVGTQVTRTTVRETMSAESKHTLQDHDFPFNMLCMAHETMQLQQVD